jgi:PhnB protein
MIQNKTLFNSLSTGGKVEMPIADSPFGSYYGMFADKYGIQWMMDFTSGN